MIEPIRYEVVQSGVTTMHRAAVGCWDRASSANDALKTEPEFWIVTGWLLANGWTQTRPFWWERGQAGFRLDAVAFAQLRCYSRGNVLDEIQRMDKLMRPCGAPVAKPTGKT